jgi:hypothetical protein
LCFGGSFPPRSAWSWNMLALSLMQASHLVCGNAVQAVCIRGGPPMPHLLKIVIIAAAASGLAMLVVILLSRRKPK